MFIDGLDEFEGREDTVIKHMTDLADQEHVKVCLSSRPSPIFEEAFNGRPSLRLQDLTFHTIRGYAKKQLSPQIQKRASLNKKDGDLAEELFTRIVERADGVFLWAIIVIRDVSDGLRGFADLNELTQAIEHLPSELESLYIRMLHRIKSPFKRDAAYFLEVALYQDNHWLDCMDLCRLHFSRSNREGKDAPFFYEEIATNELVEKCRTLETGLRSYTVGLLELTRLNPPLHPPHHYGPICDSHPQFRFYGKREDHDPILSTKIDFLHRTTRDFLLENDEAKSFLAQNGSSEAHVRLPIARGTLAQLAHFSQGEAKLVDDQWPHPIHYPYHGALSQISKAERLFGAAQARLMRSLDYESWARGYLVADDYRARLGLIEAYMVEDPATLIDVVGMAAAVGMNFYVCEQLDLTIQSRCGSFSLPDLKKYSGNRAMAATLSWSGGNQIRDIVTGSATRSPSSKYRQGLGECLQWKADDQPSSPTHFPSKKNLLAESYILSCCQPDCLDLVRVLLTAGANPMVRVEPKPVGKDANIVGPFWTSWLAFLHGHHIENLEPTGKSPGLLLDYESKNMIFDVTKGLLAQGADINYQMESGIHVYLKRRWSLAQELGVGIIASAMFILEECFNAEPEFREFAIEMEPLIERPIRKIDFVQLPEYLYKIPRNYKHCRPCPCANQCEILWPLIEKWDDSGTRDDLDALKAAAVEVWRAHYPGVKLRKWHGHKSDYYKSHDDEGDGDDESDSDNESDGDDEGDVDDEGDGDDEDVDDDKKHNDDKKNDEVEDKKDESPST